jgi:hypothetical protein
MCASAPATGSREQQETRAQQGSKVLGQQGVWKTSRMVFFIYPVQERRAHKLIKYKKITHVLFTLLYSCIKFQGQIHNNEEAVKKIKFLTYL